MSEGKELRVAPRKEHTQADVDAFNARLDLDDEGKPRAVLEVLVSDPQPRPTRRALDLPRDQYGRLQRRATVTGPAIFVRETMLVPVSSSPGLHMPIDLIEVIG